jgi:hypothetical protein
MTDEVGLAVEACVGWHDSWMRAFRLRTEMDADAWRLLDPPPQPWYFTAITRAAILADGGLPSVLAPSPEAESVYMRLGFRPVGRLRMWWRS